MSNIAILCPQGLGDALLMMILVHHAEKKGHRVVFYHSLPLLIEPLFPSVKILPYPKIEDFEKVFSAYDWILVENDNSVRAWTLIQLRRMQGFPLTTFLFPSPCPRAMISSDYLFNPRKSVVRNLQEGCNILFSIQAASKDNGLQFKKGIKNLYQNRVILHPTSKDPRKNWKKEQFLLLSRHLKKEGYDPIFTLSPEEASSWQDITLAGHQLYISSSLTELASFLYESRYFIGNDSGIGHLASNVGLPTLTIANHPSKIRLWHPDWAVNRTVTPLVLLPNFKGIGLKWRDKYWQNFITVGRVLRSFKHLAHTA